MACVKYNKVKTKPKWIKVKFKTKSGEEISFKAIKVIKVKKNKR